MEYTVSSFFQPSRGLLSWIKKCETSLSGDKQIHIIHIKTTSHYTHYSRTENEGLNRLSNVCDRSRCLLQHACTCTN